MSLPPPADLAIAVFRWLEYVGLLGFIGVVVIRRLGGMRPPITWARPSMQPALAIAFTGGVAVILTSSFRDGHPAPAVLVRVAMEGIALGFCVYLRRWAVPPAILAMLALPFAGHATALSPAGGVIFTDAVHVLSAGIWGGGIMVLATLRPPEGWGGGAGKAMLERFGRVAFLAFAITALTGAVRATQGLGDISSLWSTTYGLVLGAKTAAVLVMVVMSAVVWRRGWRYARAEGLVVLVVLAATALLTVLPIVPYPPSALFASH